jgi:hypothetical protein
VYLAVFLVVLLACFVVLYLVGYKPLALRFFDAQFFFERQCQRDNMSFVWISANGFVKCNRGNFTDLYRINLVFNRSLDYGSNVSFLCDYSGLGTTS